MATADSRRQEAFSEKQHKKSRKIEKYGSCFTSMIRSDNVDCSLKTQCPILILNILNKFCFDAKAKNSSDMLMLNNKD